MKNRNISLDIVRTIACIMVIVYHSPQPGVVNSLEASSAEYIVGYKTNRNYART